MAVIYTPHFIQFLDDDGAPLSGGKLYTYEAGTTTPKATYTTAAATVENANPVILDSAGRAVVFLSGSYRFDLYDSNDTLIRSTDNIVSFDATGTSGSINNFSTISGATPEFLDLFIFSDNSDTGVSKTVRMGALGALMSAFHSGYFTGFGTANGTDTDHDIDFSAGRGVSSDGAMLLIGSAMTKQADATWAAGTNAGGMASGQSLPTSGTIHYFALGNPTTGGCDFGFDTAVSGSNLLADAAVVAAGFTKLIYIGSMTTDSSANITQYFQNYNVFTLKTPSGSSASNPGTSAVTRTLAVPTGIIVRAKVGILVRNNTSADVISYVSPLYATDETPAVPGSFTARAVGDTGNTGEAHIEIDTNTSGQIRTRLATSAGSDAIAWTTFGWINNIGRL